MLLSKPANISAIRRSISFFWYFFSLKLCSLVLCSVNFLLIMMMQCYGQCFFAFGAEMKYKYLTLVLLRINLSLAVVFSECWLTLILWVWLDHCESTVHCLLVPPSPPIYVSLGHAIKSTSASQFLRCLFLCCLSHPHPLHNNSHARTILSSFSLTEFSTVLNFFPLLSYKLESSNGCLGVFSTLPVAIDKNTVVFDGSGL